MDSVSQAMTARTPVLTSASKLAGAVTKRIINRLYDSPDPQSRKEGMRPFARLIAKLTYTGPFSALASLLFKVRPDLIHE